MGANGDGIHLAFPRPLMGASDVGLEELILGLARDLKEQATLTREIATDMKEHAGVVKIIAEQCAILTAKVAVLERERAARKHGRAK